MTYEQSTSCVRVLVVDDFEPFRAFVCSLLKKTPGMQVICEVGDGREAVQKAVELNPDLILLDIGLPTLTGIEAAQQIRQLVPNAKILFLTQESSDDVVQKALSLGARGYVVKARAGTELSPALEAVTQGKQFVGTGLTGQYSVDPADARISGRFTHSPDEILASQPPPTSRKTLSPCLHEVQFYSTDEIFLERLTRFIAAALNAWNAVIVLATVPHLTNLHRTLQENGVDVAAAVAQGRYIPLDAAEALSTFMVGGWPDRVRFFESVGRVVTAALKAAKGELPRVAACGEMSPLLLAEGKADAAIAVERLTNELAQRYDLDILCTYPARSIEGLEDRQNFERICAEHSAIYQDEKVTQNA
jgi:DNA-binding NarL/FixJ family response regulator